MADDDALSCPHCGSDADTGWKPDADYHSVDLPDEVELPDEDDYDLETTVYRHGGLDRVRTLAGPALVVVGLAAFVGVGYQHYQLGVVLPAVFLAGLASLCLRVLTKSRFQVGH